MMKLPISLLMLVFLSLSLPPVYAEKPPLPKPLAERVNLATHVFVGRAKSVRVVEVVDGRLVGVKPEPTNTSTGEALELEVEVQEVLFPATWEPARTIKITYSHGIVSVKELRESILAGSFVYLTRIGSFDGETHFFASYPWHLVEGLGKREEIKSILEKRVTGQRETEQRHAPDALSASLL
jgi:hypothetical protein